MEVAEATDTLPVLDMTSVTGAGGDDLCEVEVEVLEESAILQVRGGVELEREERAIQGLYPVEWSVFWVEGAVIEIEFLILETVSIYHVRSKCCKLLLSEV